MIKKSLYFAICAIAFFSQFGYANEKKAYTLGAGDIVKVYVFQSPDLTTETRISEAGTIAFPLIGEVEVQGLTPIEVRNKLTDLLINGGFLVKPQVTVNVTQYVSRQASVLGQVNKPGKYPLQAGSTKMSDLLALAGGINTQGSDTLTLIRTQNGKESRIEIDMAELLKDTTKDIEIQAGDIVYVERAPVFYIYGEVQKPGAYRLERRMTVMHALSVGGGLTQRGTTRGIQLSRPNNENGKNDTVKVTLSDTIQQNDILYVKESLF